MSCSHLQMAVFLLCLLTLLLVSSISACDLCVHQAKAAVFTKSQALQIQAGGCGYGSLANRLSSGRTAAATSSVYKDGAGCGACFQIRCKKSDICSKEGSVIMVNDSIEDDNNSTAFVMSDTTYASMARKGMKKQLLKLGNTDILYKRVECEYVKNKNLSIRVDESSRKPDYLAIQILYQRGLTEIVAVDVAQVGSPNWMFMNRKVGALWVTQKVPIGALQFRFVVTAGYDGKWYWAQNVFPSDWINGVIYDTSLQITDIAQQDCSPCHTI